MIFCFKMVKIIRIRSQIDSVGSDLSVRWLRAILRLQVSMSSFVRSVFLYGKETSGYSAGGDASFC